MKAKLQIKANTIKILKINPVLSIRREFDYMGKYYHKVNISIIQLIKVSKLAIFFYKS